MKQGAKVMNKTLLTATELAERIKFSPAYINHVLKDTVLLQGVHYIRPFGGRKLLFLWEPIEDELLKNSAMFECFHG